MHSGAPDHSGQRMTLIDFGNITVEVPEPSFGDVSCESGSADRLRLHLANFTGCIQLQHRPTTLGSIQPESTGNGVKRGEQDTPSSLAADEALAPRKMRKTALTADDDSTPLGAEKKSVSFTDKSGTKVTFDDASRAPAESVGGKASGMKPGLLLEHADWSPLNAASAPAPRWGHSSCCIGDNQLVVLGGENGLGDVFNTMHVLDRAGASSSADQWRAIPIRSPLFGHRTWHAAVTFPKVEEADDDDDEAGENLLVFGGETVRPGHDRRGQSTRLATNDLLIYDPKFSVWFEGQTTGPKPCPRSGHAMARVGTRIFVFGGCRRATFLNDLTMLDTETMQWSRPPVASNLAPAGRAYHTLTAVEKGSEDCPEWSLYLFGGNNEEQSFCDLWLLDLATWCSSFCVLNSLFETHACAEQNFLIRKWWKPEHLGERVSPRIGASAIHHRLELGGGQLLILGGWDYADKAGDKYYDSALVLNTTTFQWENLDPLSSGTQPTPRAGQTVTAVGNSCIVFGGRDSDELFVEDSWQLALPYSDSQCTHTANAHGGVEGLSLNVSNNMLGRQKSSVTLSSKVSALKEAESPAPSAESGNEEMLDLQDSEAERAQNTEATGHDSLHDEAETEAAHWTNALGSQLEMTQVPLKQRQNDGWTENRRARDLRMENTLNTD